MKKIITLIAITAIIACNNSADTTTTKGSSDSDTVSKSVIPPPVSIDSSALTPDSVRFKKAIKK